MLFKGQERCEKCVLLLKVRGKRGSTRVCYVDFEIRETIYLLAVFAKNELENLTKEERNELKKLIKILEENL